MKNEKSRLLAAMLCGALGCLCYGGGDWLMIYGDTAHAGKLYWLTLGAADIAAWRNGLAMLLAFPGVVLYGIALFYLGRFIKSPREQKIYHYLNAFGLTPWMALHLFYIMILYLYAWMTHNGYADAALPACEALFSHLSWIVMVSEALMLPVFLYWLFVVATGRTTLPRAAALGNVLVFYVLLYAVKTAMPDTPFRIGFTNGLMSESMLLFFLVNGLAAKKTLKAAE